MNKLVKKVRKEVASTIAGSSVPLFMVAAAGETGISAVGLTTGLAALGMGMGMLDGIAIVGAISICSYNLTKYAIELIEGDE